MAVSASHYMKMTTRRPFSAIYSYDGVTGRHEKGVPFFNKRYIKRVLFSAKMVYKRVRGWTSGGASQY